MKKRILVMLGASVMTALLLLMVSLPAAAAASSLPSDKAGVGMIILAMVLVGLAIALIVIRIMAGQMNTVNKQSSAKGYGQKLLLTDRSDVYLYSRTSTRRVNNR